MKKRFYILTAGLAAVLVFPLASHAATVLFDDFTGSIVSAAKWHIPTWQYNGDGTWIGQTQFRCSQNAPLPSASNGATTIAVQSYNPTGFSFYGTDLISNQSLTLDQGLDITVRAKMNTTTPGIVGGIFLYALKPGSNTLHDEIDFEFLTNSPNQFNTNIYGNEALGVGRPKYISYASSGSMTAYHTYEIKWLPNQVTWLVDGNVVRTETSNVPTGPMNFHFNMWVPDSSWSQAYNANLKATSSASANKIYSMSVDSINVQSMTAPVLKTISISPTTASMVLGATFIGPLPPGSTGVVPTKQLTATALDQNNSPMTVPLTWSSSNPFVAMVNSSGVVRAYANGVTKITASSGSIKSAPAVITITTAPRPALKTITIAPTAASLAVGGATKQLTTTTLDQFGKPILAVLTWTSSNPTVATVNSNGLVTPLAAGTANITAASGSVKSAPAVITVTNPTVSYTYAKINTGNTVEHRFFAGPQQFMTIVMDANNAIALRPHPGLDVNGWGSSLYLQPFLPGATLRGTTIQVTPRSTGINVAVSGLVSQGSSASNGTWNGNFTFSYNAAQKDITGSGTYNINLANALSASTGDLNLFKLASNYLTNVPLLNGTTGDTGDVSSVLVTGAPFNLTWIPKTGSTYPQDYRNPISIEAVGNYNQVNTAAQGYAAIAAAYKPSLKVVLSSSQTGLPLIFGASYDASKSQQFWADNVGITPLILKSSTLKTYNFNVSFSSKAIAGDH